jgi:uncharacterized protein (TIGR02594 family)
MFISNPVFAGFEIDTVKDEPYEEAMRWLGASEKNAEHVDALEWYFDKYLESPVNPVKTPWCAAFVDAVLKKTGHERLDSLWARDFLKYGDEVTGFPKKGDIIVLKRKVYNGHVGFFIRFAKDKNGNRLIGVLGGNTDGEVKIGYYPMDYVLGIRRP